MGNATTTEDKERFAHADEFLSIEQLATRWNCPIRDINAILHSSKLLPAIRIFRDVYPLLTDDKDPTALVGSLDDTYFVSGMVYFDYQRAFSSDSHGEPEIKEVYASSYMDWSEDIEAVWNDGNWDIGLVEPIRLSEISDDEIYISEEDVEDIEADYPYLQASNTGAHVAQATDEVIEAKSVFTNNLLKLLGLMTFCYIDASTRVQNANEAEKQRKELFHADGSMNRSELHRAIEILAKSDKVSMTSSSGLKQKSVLAKLARALGEIGY